METMAECWTEFEDAINAGVNRIVLFGPPGTGKTYMGMHYGVPDGVLAHRLQCTVDMTEGKITGHMLPVSESKWEFNTGPLPRAWEEAGRVVVDEVDKVGGDAESLLLGMLDSPDSARWEHPITKKMWRPKEGFTAIMTTNLERMQDLPIALSDRFPVKIRINQPHPSALARLSQDIRRIAAASPDAKGERRFSLRAFEEFDKLRKQLGDAYAAKLIFRSQAQGILDAIKVEAIA